MKILHVSSFSPTDLASPTYLPLPYPLPLNYGWRMMQNSKIFILSFIITNFFLSCNRFGCRASSYSECKRHLISKKAKYLLTSEGEKKVKTENIFLILQKISSDAKNIGTQGKEGEEMVLLLSPLFLPCCLSDTLYQRHSVTMVVWNKFTRTYQFVQLSFYKKFYPSDALTWPQ